MVALRLAVALLAFGVLPTTGTVTPAETPALDDTREECAHLLAQIPEPADESATHPRARELYSRVWTLVGELASAYLDAHPDVSGDELAAVLMQLEPLSVTALQLRPGERAAYLVAPTVFGGGTLLVAARDQNGRFRTAWSIADASARTHVPAKELGYWTSFDPLPISGTVHELPPTRTGNARFYVDGVTRVAAGCFWPFQISIWEWNEHEAIPLLIETYGRTFDTPPNELRGDVLVVHTKEISKVFHTVSCDAHPEGLWNIKITPSAIEDQRPVFVDQSYYVLDTLFDRIFQRQDASDIASARVTRLLADALASVGRPPCEIHLRVQHGRRRDVVDTASDECGDFTFWIEHRHGKLYVAKAKRASFVGVLR